MFFFMFEAVSCMASGDCVIDRKCSNTTSAAAFLSSYLVLITGASIASRTISKGERGEGMTYVSLALLRLEKKQMVQGIFGVVTVLVSMYLFSVLGVEAEPTDKFN